MVHHANRSLATHTAMRGCWRLVAAVVACLLVASPVPAAAATQVVFTFDVESKDPFRLPAQIDAVCRDGTACGLMEMVRLLQARGWPGTFFLNVYEHRQLGETAMRDIAVALQTAGQDVALHTHPDAAYDLARPSMHQYSLDEQMTIVRDGVRLLQQWTGQPVVAHRTGAYAADERTLDALQRNGILVDSSLFWTYPASRLDTLGLPRNLPSRHGRVAEIPVTVYVREDHPRIFGTVFAPVRTVRKIDADWLVNEEEMRSAIDAVVAADIPVLVIFLHSFSFMTAPADGGPPLTNHHSLDLFRAILDHVARKGLPVVTMRDLAGREVEALPRERDVVPSVALAVAEPVYVWRRMKHSPTFAVGVGVGLAGLVAACGLVPAVVLMRRRRAAAARAAIQGATQDPAR